MQKDLIIFIGPSGCGKTEGINRAKQFFQTLGMPFEKKPIADGPFILQQIAKDHERTGGRNHYHGWCEKNTEGHTHPKNETDFSFTVFGYPIVQGMYKDFFPKLSRAPHTGKFIFVEWSGGVGQSHTNPQHTADYSYARMVQEFKDGTYDKQWFSRVAAVIHPVTPDFETRLRLNKKRQIPNAHEIEYGERSWPLPYAAMQSFAGDDARVMEAYLLQEGVDCIVDIPNDIRKVSRDGTPEYLERLDGALEKVFSRHIRQESVVGRRKEGGR